MSGVILFSLFDPDNPMPGLGPMSPAVREQLVFLGGGLLLVVVVLIVLIVRRKLKRRSKRRERSRHRQPFPHATSGTVELKQTRRRHSRRPRNPTLAETGGLPPLRQDGSVEPPQTQTQP